jgi:FixJ family two-component response regulator
MIFWFRLTNPSKLVGICLLIGDSFDLFVGFTSMAEFADSDSPVVYVVDDDHDVRDGLKSFLDSVGFRSQTFASTSEFLQSKHGDEVSCLVLDVRLPGLSGLDLQAELAQAHVVTPIIFITGYGDIPMSVKAMKGGAVDFLTKPVREQELLVAVRHALTLDRARRAEIEKSRDLRTRHDTLTPREREIMGLICAGLKSRNVAVKMGISTTTVKVHRHNLMKKLGATSFVELVRMADRLKVR